MSISKAAKRYARAVVGLARDTGAMDRVVDDLLALGALIRSSEAFAAFLGNPLVSPDRRAAAFKALLERKSDPLTGRFLLMLAQKRRLGLLAEICEEAGNLRDEERGILRVRIVSASPMEASQVSAIRDRLHRKYDKTIEAETAVDPSLIGGFKVQVGDTIYDTCVSTRLETLRQQLTNA